MKKTTAVKHVSSVRDALVFLYVSELRSLAQQFALSKKGKKMELIIRILHFLQTGEKLIATKIPASVCAERGKVYPLTPKGRMLKGSYKNDLKTRLFFKGLIGEHFHFTAYGIDWLNHCWLEGRAPTYQEFADMWVAEYQRRQTHPAAAKEEWAYINFVQQMPNRSREAIQAAWEQERQLQKAYVEHVISQLA